MNLNKPISEIMTADVISVAPTQKLVDIKHLFETKHFHYNIPVTENGQLVGVIVLTDLLYAIKNASEKSEGSGYESMLVREIMRELPVVKSPSTTIKDLSEEFSHGETHAIMVVEKGTLLGIVSSADVISHFLAMNKG
jgi:hypothetical protein